MTTKEEVAKKPKPKAVLDKRMVADCTFDAIPTFDSSGKQVGTAPNEAQTFYDIYDTHKDAPTGFRLRVNRNVKTYVLVQRVGENAYFSDRGRLFQADRGRRIGVAVAAPGRRAGTGLNVAESSTISLKPAAAGRVSGSVLSPT